MGPFWRKCGLNDCTVLYFSEIKWFWEHFEVTIYLCIANYMCMIAVHRTSNVVSQTYNINWYVSRLISCSFVCYTQMMITPECSGDDKICPLLNSLTSLNIIKTVHVIARHIAWMEKCMKGLVRNSERKMLHGRYRCRMEDNNKVRNRIWRCGLD